MPPTPSNESRRHLFLMVKPTRARALAFSSPGSPGGTEADEPGSSGTAPREEVMMRTGTKKVSLFLWLWAPHAARVAHLHVNAAVRREEAVPPRRDGRIASEDVDLPSLHADP